MQIGIMSRAFSRPGLKEKLDAVAEHGLYCMQFDLSSAGLRSLPNHIDEAECDKIRKAMSAHKIGMSGVNGMYNMIHPD